MKTKPFVFGAVGFSALIIGFALSNCRGRFDLPSPPAASCDPEPCLPTAPRSTRESLVERMDAMGDRIVEIELKVEKLRDTRK